MNVITPDLHNFVQKVHFHGYYLMDTFSLSFQKKVCIMEDVYHGDTDDSSSSTASVDSDTGEPEDLIATGLSISEQESARCSFNLYIENCHSNGCQELRPSRGRG